MCVPGSNLYIHIPRYKQSVMQCHSHRQKVWHMKYFNYLIKVIRNIVKKCKIWKFGNSEIVHLGPIFIVFMDYNKWWITFDIIRFNPSYPSFVFQSFIYFYYMFFKQWQISVELFHDSSLSRKDLTSIYW